MIWIGIVGLGGWFVMWRMRRRAIKRSMVAGLVPERPAFTVPPPPGRLGRMKDGAL